MRSSYSEEVQDRFGLLTVEEEIELAKKISKGDKKAEEKLICSNLKFVASICRKYLGQGIELDDLIGAGNLGLVCAAKRYNPEEHNNEKFITFAVWYIKHYVFEAIMMNRFSFRIPNSYHNDILRFCKIKQQLTSKLNRDPTKEELIESLKIEETRLDTIIDFTDQNKFVSLSDFVCKAKGLTYADVICTDQKGIDKYYDLRERRIEILKALKVLTEREKFIIVSYYGLMGVSYSLKELGDELNLTMEAIRIIRNNALKKLSSKDLSLRDFLIDS
jgi:RNA polymerase primary sigma factor